jgi:hypothetical protein
MNSQRGYHYKKTVIKRFFYIRSQDSFISQRASLTITIKILILTWFCRQSESRIIK